MADVLELPVWCGEVELDPRPSTLPEPPARHFSQRLLLKLRGEPLGYATAPVGSPLKLEEAVAQLGAPARDRVRHAWADDGDHRPDPVPATLRISVAVCTRERPESLERCLQHLRRLNYPNTELLVVDNAPTSGRTRALVASVQREDERVRYVHEPRPGLSRARNRAMHSASGHVIAYTDDDVRVDERWLEGVALGFQRRKDVACVTGLVATAGIETAVEAYFDARVSWAHVRPPRLFNLTDHRDDSSMYPYAAGLFGTGANFAFRTSVLRELGGFDEALGAGACTRGGEDLDAFVRVLAAGHSIAHEPSAIVWHHHRAELKELQQQMFSYGTGLSAFYVKHLVNPGTRRQLMRVLPQGLARLAAVPSASDSAAGPASLHRNLVLRELAGMAAGPFLYARARRTA
ncbi:glycosyltransferase [Kineococcus sp. T13]|uniref:glycosyltransferase family 2 protein n=1 Tax=Kineococcus vitellinus TaxID=2696565 RepID=UPI00141308E3|nr:glycosyltransferase [Kineococcus vitellinus]NAZ74088.1 glycosyltransferase [Kineococcus vitellinus]